jgi:hypothetical protein
MAQAHTVYGSGFCHSAAESQNDSITWYHVISRARVGTLPVHLAMLCVPRLVMGMVWWLQTCVGTQLVDQQAPALALLSSRWFASRASSGDCYEPDLACKL